MLPLAELFFNSAKGFLFVSTVPQQLINTLKGVKGFDEESFKSVHQSGVQLTSIRINPAKININDDEELKKLFPQTSFSFTDKVPWCAAGFYLPQRPSFTFDPLFHAGCYYVQEASSMFLEQALIQATDLAQPLKVLDLCAAPGGKSTHIQSLISADSLLVSNEVIKNRAGVLRQNIIKWGAPNVVVTNNDPQHFSKLEGFFDVLVVDAPCSGSGLFRRDAEAINEWSEEAVQLCCGRQKRIISDALPALKKDGVLIYSTCSYSVEEDEAIADWLVQEQGMENIMLHVQDDWNIVVTEAAQTGAKGYRFFPDKVKGEGFFLAAFRKKEETGAPKFKTAKLEKATAKEKAIVDSWLANDDLEVLYHTTYLYGLSKKFITDYSIIKNYLNVQYAGMALGAVMKEKLIPEHALALSGLLKKNITVTEIDFETAIRYLQKQDVAMEAAEKGWQLVAYKHHNLGWINALQNRVNNYYPKEMRILKQKDDTAFEK